MTEKLPENNRVCVTGEIVSGFRFSHEVYGEGFYMVDIEVTRLSSQSDFIPIMVSERLIDTKQDYTGRLVRVSGQFRSYNRHESRKNRLVLSVFAREIEFPEEITPAEKTNEIWMDGYVCKEPVFRRTPLGREITDILLAVNRSYGKSDYIPCICWGRNARFAAGFEVGSHVQMIGRIQSREYVKKLEGDETERRVAYEVSVAKLELVPEKEQLPEEVSETGSDYETGSGSDGQQGTTSAAETNPEEEQQD